ncbi:MAG: archaemetzincin family Zn-dependent metalloprotease [Deltaproteobacteria bacterium]|nr:archaemetzincin family Zn-dependent metalloprotease [Deltaproteobacteria bacterium]
MTSKQRLIGVVPFGEVPEIALKIIAAHISALLNLPSRILPSLKRPEYALDTRKYQYDAGIIIEALESMSFKNCEKVIGVLDIDLFIPIFTHVFGEAKQGGKFALVSLFRLGKNSDGSSSPASLLYERAVKVALHELGHLFDLLHCEHKRCLMHFSGSIEELDEQPLYLCNYCSIYLQDKLNTD